MDFQFSRMASQSGSTLGFAALQRHVANKRGAKILIIRAWHNQLA